MCVVLWLESRNFLCNPLPVEEGDFVIIDDELEKQYDAFKAEIKDTIFIPENDLLYHWYTVEDNTSCVDTVNKFGKKYFILTQENVDAFFMWMKEKKESLRFGVM